MNIASIKIVGARNLVSCDLDFGSRFNVLSGENGQGKTNLIEMLYLIGTLRSFRAKNIRELIQFEQEQLYIKASVEKDASEHNYTVIVSETGRKAYHDDKFVRSITKYCRDMRIVLFTPEDLRVVRGSPSDRRRFLDRAVYGWNEGYLSAVQSYDKVLRSRNSLLRDPSPMLDLLDVYDVKLASLGSEIIQWRCEYLNELLNGYQKAFYAINQSDAKTVAFSYESSVSPDLLKTPEQIEPFLHHLLHEKRGEDQHRGSTSIGPHRDDLIFCFDGRNAFSFASQGQLRAMVLAWKTGEMNLLGKKHGDWPLLLLDDVSSELDPARNEYLFQFLRTTSSQCFITTTHSDHVLLDDDRIDFTVSNGVVSRQD